MEKTLKKFNLKCNLIDSKTKRSVGFKILTIYGTCGNDAVSAYANTLKSDGLELDDNYTYSEIGLVS